MKWITRERPKTDRIACPWLISRFIDPDAEIIFAPAAEVLTVAAREDGHSFDAPGATYTHRGTACTIRARRTRAGSVSRWNSSIKVSNVQALPRWV